MPNVYDLIRGAARAPGQQFELDLDDKHLRSRVAPELRPLEGAFRFVPVDHDPFEDPKDAAARKAKK